MTSYSLISRRRLLETGGAAAAALALPRIPAAFADAPLSFLAVGDWGHASAKARAVAAAMGRTAETINSRFVISLGDNFYPHGVENVNDRQWTETFERAFIAPSLMTPWNVVAGNHDHRGNALAQVEYSRVSKRWRMPSLYYKRRERLAADATADFFYIDTETMRTEAQRPKKAAFRLDAQEQLAWLERELAASRAAWKIVVGHHPVYSGGSHGNTKRLVNWLPSMFRRYGVQVYIAGHNHNLEHLEIGGTHYLTSGGGADPHGVKTLPATRFGAGELGFLSARLGPAVMNIEFVGQDGGSLYRAAIPLGA
ncbi:MAG TPA: tartrate-resistant acid phosphatase type 5 family protein [Xanthobacteraceae bacterium]|nr:tartrate-resistant acid phosphatase type 5 family protein [Xanthobacteraceae bacterium]